MKNATGESVWGELAENYFAYLKKSGLDDFNWEGQFEDIKPSPAYTNLTHFPADNMISYLLKNKTDDPEMLEDIIVAAVNEGIKRVQDASANEMSALAAKYGIPDGAF
jgi:spore germination protein YaaH